MFEESDYELIFSHEYSGYEDWWHTYILYKNNTYYLYERGCDLYYPSKTYISGYEEISEEDALNLMIEIQIEGGLVEC